MDELQHHTTCLNIEQLRSLNREDALCLAGVCEKAARYKDMLCVLLALISTWAPSTKVESEERTLLSIAYNKQVLPLRVAIRNVTESLNLEKCESVRGMLESLRDGMVAELEALCNEFIELVQRIVLFESSFQDADAIIWAYKTVGDHYRYQAELFLPGRDNVKELAEGAFVKGLSEAQTRLVPTSPLRLSLALNYAVFLYEIAQDEEKGRSIAQDALDAAEAEITSLKVAHSALPDTETLLRLIQKTLATWKANSSSNNKSS